MATVSPMRIDITIYWTKRPVFNAIPTEYDGEGTIFQQLTNEALRVGDDHRIQ